MKKIDFIGVGVPRSATTWLGECLASHPEINFSSQFCKKEINFFSDNYKKGIDWYLNLFPNEKGKIQGEYSPTYFWNKTVADRIKKHLPNVKIIITIRNPVDMIYSLYWMAFNAIQVDRPSNFDQAIKVDMTEELKLFRALYADRISQYLNLFPRKNVQFILFDDICKDPKKVIRVMYSFLEVSDDFKPENLSNRINIAEKTRSGYLKVVLRTIVNGLNRPGLRLIRRRLLNNLTLYKIYSKINKENTKYPPMKEETRLKLINYYREDILKTEKLIGRNLSQWLKA
jgi:hypothetical protein